jgi:cysteine desulfurase/selenocysteine lyase
VSLIDVRSDFPALNQKIHGHPLVYLDSAASTLKSQVVIDAITHHYTYDTANVHRGIHFLSAQGTTKYEETRSTVKTLINAAHEHEVIFTKGTTDSINIVASSWSEAYLQEADEILISTMEHHSNIVPWQMAAQKRKAKVVEIPITQAGDLDLEAFKKLLNPKVKMVAISAISNTLGTVNPIEEVIALAHQHGSHVLVDAAQSISHAATDVQKLDCDFLVFSAHKMFGPTGVGILYGKEDLLNDMPPYQGGGAMIKTVSFDGTTYNDLPEKFEAGTPHIAGVIAFKAALDYITTIGLDKIWAHEQELLAVATQKISQLAGVKIIGTSKHKAGVLSFTMEGAHPHDLGMILDEQGIAIRTGHHCTQPLMNYYQVPATARASFAIYNNLDDIERFIAGLKKAQELL